MATVRADVGAAELKALHAAGVRGVRFNFVKRLADSVPRETLAAIAARIAPLWPPGPHALAWAAAKAAEAVLGRSRRTLSGFIAPDDSNGRRARTAALPLRLGETGVLSDELPPLSVHERVAFENAVML